MSRTRFRVNPHSIVAWMSRNSLLEAGAKSEVFAPASNKEFLDIQATIECGFTLKRVRDMIRTYSQMHRTEKYSQHSSIILSVWLNGWVFVYELSGCGFESSCSHLYFRFRACFEQGVPWHSDNYRVWIHSETRTWHDKNIQSNAPYREVLTTQLNHLASLAKWLSVRLWTKWLWVRVQLQSQYQLVEKCNSLYVSVSCVVQLIEFN